MRTLTPVVAMVLCLAASVSWGQSILRVRASAPAGGSGQSWATAYNTLSAALSAAVAGDEVWVAAGTYTGIAGRAAFQMKSNVAVYGGFAAIELQRAQRDPIVNATTLSGSGQRTVVAFLNVANGTLDGFRIVGGVGAGDFQTDPTQSSPGGGFYFLGSSAMIANCDIDGNVGWILLSPSGGPASYAGDGAGAFVRSSTVSFRFCRIANGRVSTTITDCQGGHPTVHVFAGRGAGIAATLSNIDMVGCTVIANRASDGANGFGCTSTLLAIAGTAGGPGGGFYGTATNLRVDRCSFIGNSAGGGGSGGGPWGMCSRGGGPPGNGGAICNDGTTIITDSSFIGNRTRTNTFTCSDNTGGYGSAVYAAGPMSISSSLFYANFCPGSQGGLGAIYGSPSRVSNCIFWANSNDSGITHFAQLGNVGTWVMDHCVIQNLAAASAGNSNLNPLFLDPLGPDNILGTADDRFDLAIGSPAIDAGDNAAAAGLTLDLAGNPRFFDVPQIPDTGVGIAPIVDIGPYEFSHCPVDLDNGSGNGTPDNAVTIDDLLYFLTAFESGTPAADLDNGTTSGVHDHAVTIDDLLFFLAHFEAGC